MLLAGLSVTTSPEAARLMAKLQKRILESVHARALRAHVCARTDVGHLGPGKLAGRFVGLDRVNRQNPQEVAALPIDHLKLHPLDDAVNAPDGDRRVGSASNSTHFANHAIDLRRPTPRAGGLNRGREGDVVVLEDRAQLGILLPRLLKLLGGDLTL